MAEKKIENFALKLLFLEATLIFLITLLAALFTKSLALATVTVYNAFGLLISFLYLYVAKKIEVQKDEQHHFGFFKLEPLIVILEAIVIIGTCVFGIIVALQHIIFLKEHDIKNPQGGLLITLISLLIYALVWMALNTFIKKSPSDLLKANLISTKTDFSLSFGVLLGFLALIFFEKYKIGGSQYIDPVVTIGISLFLITEPIKLLKSGIIEITDQNPDPIFRREISAICDEILKEHNCYIKPCYLSLRKAGRQFFSVVDYWVKEDLTFSKIAEVNEAMHKSLETRFGNLKIFCHPQLYNKKDKIVHSQKS